MFFSNEEKNVCSWWHLKSFVWRVQSKETAHMGPEDKSVQLTQGLEIEDRCQVPGAE